MADAPNLWRKAAVRPAARRLLVFGCFPRLLTDKIQPSVSEKVIDAIYLKPPPRLAGTFHTPEGLLHRTLRESSVRSAMSIAKLRRGNQAPLGAACRPTASRESNMPLLTELENNLVEPRSYKHGAPNGANPFAQGCKVFKLASSARSPVAPTRGESGTSLQSVGASTVAGIVHQ